MATPENVVFIHGMYMNGLSWGDWMAVASKRGYSPSAPSWPHHDGSPAELRAHVDPALGKLRFAAVVDRYKQIIDALPERPVLVGHSVGGLVVQKLVNEGYAAAGVAIAPAPPPGVFVASRHFVKANFPHINPFAGNAPIVMTRERFHYTFCNTMTRHASDEAFDRYVVPESRNIPRSTLTKEASIDFAAPHAPLMLIAASDDHLTPLALIEKNTKAYGEAGQAVEFRAFENRSHYICNQPGWEEVAEYSFEWLASLPSAAM